MATAIVQAFFKARSHVRIAAYDLTNIAGRLNELDQEFGNPDPHPLNDLAQRVDAACDTHLVRPDASHGFPAVSDPFAGSHQATTIDGRLAALPPAANDDRTAMLLHGIMQCITMAAVSIGSALQELRDIERRMEEFAHGSSATIAGIHPVMVPIAAGLRESLMQLQAQCELASHESFLYDWQERLQEFF
jgi:hypothetical protein